MCKHILNAQVAIRAPCCKKWYDCAECHDEKQDHPLESDTTEITMICKKCRKAFRKDMQDFEEADEYCPGCDNHYYIEAQTPEQKMELQVEAKEGYEHKLIKDDREKDRKSVFIDTDS